MSRNKEDKNKEVENVQSFLKKLEGINDKESAIKNKSDLNYTKIFYLIESLYSKEGSEQEGLLSEIKVDLEYKIKSQKILVDKIKSFLEDLETDKEEISGELEEVLEESKQRGFCEELKLFLDKQEKNEEELDKKFKSFLKEQKYVHKELDKKLKSFLKEQKHVHKELDKKFKSFLKEQKYVHKELDEKLKIFLKEQEVINKKLAKKYKLFFNIEEEENKIKKIEKILEEEKDNREIIAKELNCILANQEKSNNEDIVKSLKLILEKIEKIAVKNKKLFYRGQSNIDYDLTPSVLRKKFKDSEDKIYDEIMVECAHEFDDCKLHNEILSKMQHYDVPTRLLDITTNSLVALYFACGGKAGNDGIVYVIRSNETKKYDSDAISILSALPRFSSEEKDEIEKSAKILKGNLDQDSANAIEYFNKKEQVKRLLHEIKKEKPAFENIINPRDVLKNFIFTPRKVNTRIIRQSGGFIIFGLGEKDLNEDPDYLIEEIIIKGGSKEDILEELSLLGISKSNLQPELYKVAEDIKDRYENR